MKDSISSHPTAIFWLIAAGTVIGLAGTDLVLPAIPSLPGLIKGTATQAQWVLAAFATGSGIGLLLFGTLGTRYPIGQLLVASLFSYALLSWLATLSQSLDVLVTVRFFQGIASSAPAVFAPIMVRSMYDPQSSIAMLGRIGSVESMAPALAPVAGAWLLGLAGWQASFYVTAAIAAGLACIWLLNRAAFNRFGQVKQSRQGYLPLLRQGTFIRYALSNAFTLGALLIFVFGAPKVIVTGMDGALSDFVVMQVLGITCFVVFANSANLLVKRWGEHKTIVVGSIVSAAGCLTICLYAYAGGSDVEMLWLLFLLVNSGLGVRGPPGFYMALMAAGDNEARGSALVILLSMLTAALGTAVIAPMIEDGLLPLSTMAAAVSALSVLLLIPGKALQR